MSIFTMGVDVGSTASKCVIIKDGKEIVATAVVPVGTGTSGPARVMKQALEQLGFTSMEQLNGAIATGYGRNSLKEVPAQMSELSCHAKGAYFLFPRVRTIIDIGGQDSKALKLSDNGMLENFVMNDKCAAGTGRFLDVIAKELTISSTCTVFAESEVISQLASGAKIPDIVKGIHTAIASRVGSLAKRVGIQDDVIMTGGVALNKGMVRALEKNIGFKIHTSEYCQLNGAIGAALFAHQKCAQAGK